MMYEYFNSREKYFRVYGECAYCRVKGCISCMNGTCTGYVMKQMIIFHQTNLVSLAHWKTARTLTLAFHATKLVIISYQTKNVFLALWKDVWTVKVLAFVRNMMKPTTTI